MESYGCRKYSRKSPSQCNRLLWGYSITPDLRCSHHSIFLHAQNNLLNSRFERLPVAVWVCIKNHKLSLEFKYSYFSGLIDECRLIIEDKKSFQSKITRKHSRFPSCAIDETKDWVTEWKILKWEFHRIWLVNISDTYISIEIYTISKSCILLPFTIFIEIEIFLGLHFPDSGRVLDHLWENIVGKDDRSLAINGKKYSGSYSAIDDKILSTEIRYYIVYRIRKTCECDKSIQRDNPENVRTIHAFDSILFPCSRDSYWYVSSAERLICITDESIIFSGNRIWIIFQKVHSELHSRYEGIRFFFRRAQSYGIMNILHAWRRENQCILHWRNSKNTGSSTVFCEVENAICNWKVFIFKFSIDGDIEFHPSICRSEVNVRLLYWEEIPIEKTWYSEKEEENDESEESRTHRKICNCLHCRENRGNFNSLKAFLPHAQLFSHIRTE